MRTFNGFQWEIGKWYETTGEGKFYSSGWLHFYSDPLVGLFLNPIHMDIRNFHLFRAEVEGNFIDDNGLSCGYSRARLIEELPVPQISPVQRVRFAIFCAKEVYKEKGWNKWANNWLSGKDRTEESAASVESAIITAQIIAQNIAQSTAQSTAQSAYYAENSAYYAEESAASIESAFFMDKNAFYAAESALSATKSKKIDLIRIARKAMEE